MAYIAPFTTPFIFIYYRIYSIVACISHRKSGSPEARRETPISLSKPQGGDQYVRGIRTKCGYVYGFPEVL